ncbi:hypothetical protein BH10PSE12_BH10PSE12_02060 [soil metagenome]
MIHDMTLQRQVDMLPTATPSPALLFLLRGWRWTLMATLSGSLIVTAGVALLDGPLWTLLLDWSVTLAYAGLVAFGMKHD